MTIVLFGSSLVSAYWNGAATYYRGICKALHACGHHIVFVEPYGPSSVTNFPLALMRDEIARKSGATVDIVAIGGRAGGSVLDYVLSPPPA